MFVSSYFSAVKNVEIASYSGIIGAIVTNTLDCSVSLTLFLDYFHFVTTMIF